MPPRDGSGRERGAGDERRVDADDSEHMVHRHGNVQHVVALDGKRLSERPAVQPEGRRLVDDGLGHASRTGREHDDRTVRRAVGKRAALIKATCLNQVLYEGHRCAGAAGGKHPRVGSHLLRLKACVGRRHDEHIGLYQMRRPLELLLLEAVREHGHTRAAQLHGSHDHGRDYEVGKREDHGGPGLQPALVLEVPRERVRVAVGRPIANRVVETHSEALVGRLEIDVPDELHQGKLLELATTACSGGKALHHT